MKETVLFDGKSGNIRVYIDAKITNGCLCISGQDLGDELIEYFGKDEHEYFYRLNKEDTERFFSLIPENSFAEKFSGPDACIKFRGFCRENNISYDLTTF